MMVKPTKLVTMAPPPPPPPPHPPPPRSRPVSHPPPRLSSPPARSEPRASFVVSRPPRRSSRVTPQCYRPSPSCGAVEIAIACVPSLARRVRASSRARDRSIKNSLSSSPSPSFARVAPSSSTHRILATRRRPPPLADSADAAGRIPISAATRPAAPAPTSTVSVSSSSSSSSVAAAVPRSGVVNRRCRRPSRSWRRPSRCAAGRDVGADGDPDGSIARFDDRSIDASRFDRTDRSRCDRSISISTSVERAIDVDRVVGRVRSVAASRGHRIDRWKTRVRRRARDTARRAIDPIGRRVVVASSSSRVASSSRRVVAASSSSASRSKLNTINHRPVVRAFVRKRARARRVRHGFHG